MLVALSDCEEWAMYALVDEYLGVRMDVDLSKVSCDETTIVESGRRLVPETS